MSLPTWRRIPLLLLLASSVLLACRPEPLARPQPTPAGTDQPQPVVIPPGVEEPAPRETSPAVPTPVSGELLRTKWGVHLLLDDGTRQWPVEVWDEHLAYARRVV